MVNAEPAFWAASMSNVAWLRDKGEVASACCLAPASAELATELRAWCPKVEAVNWPTADADLHARLVQKQFDAVIVVTGRASPPFAVLAGAVAPGARLYLLLPHDLARDAVRACRREGWQPESHVLVATSVHRALHFVPDTVPGLLAWFEMEPPARAWPRWLLQIALRLGWRPRAFGARLLVARRES